MLLVGCVSKDLVLITQEYFIKATSELRGLDCSSSGDAGKKAQNLILAALE